MNYHHAVRTCRVAFQSADPVWLTKDVQLSWLDVARFIIGKPTTILIFHHKTEWLIQLFQKSPCRSWSPIEWPWGWSPVHSQCSKNHSYPMFS